MIPSYFTYIHLAAPVQAPVSNVFCRLGLDHACLYAT